MCAMTIGSFRIGQSCGEPQDEGLRSRAERDAQDLSQMISSPECDIAYPTCMFRLLRIHLKIKEDW